MANIAETVKKQTDRILRQRGLNGTEGVVVSGVSSGTVAPPPTVNNPPSDLTAHKASSDHDGRYYTEDEIDGMLNFLGLSDTPAAYTGQAGKVPTVNVTEDGLEFSDLPGASPLTTKGDVYVYGSADARLPIGADGQVLTADSGETLGVKWVTDVRGIPFAIYGIDLTTALKVGYPAPLACTITGGKIQVGTSPTGAALICDVHKNGTTLWTTQGNRPTIAADGTSANITMPDVTSIEQGDLLEFQIDQIGSTVAGKDLSLTLYCKVVT